jgi:predicted nucleic acid-binding protein
MNLEEKGWVVDASVAIQLFITGPLSDSAYRLFAHLIDTPPTRIYVPDLFYIEIANTLWKYVRWQGLPIEQAQEYLQELGRLDLQTVSSAQLMGDALTQAMLYHITAYDACYVALAQHLSLPLITADAKLANTLQDTERVQLLT